MIKLWENASVQPPRAHRRHCKRQAFEAIAWSAVPVATVHKAEEPLISEELVEVGPEKVSIDRPAPKKILGRRAS